MNRAVRIVLFVVVAAAVIVLLFTTIFPWVEQQLEQDPTMGATVTVASPTGHATG